MYKIFAIIKQTLRAHIRSKALWALIPILSISTWILSSADSGDGTLRSLFLVRLEYSINSCVILAALLTLWLSSVNLASDEVESHRIQMLITKPVSILQIWLGKFFGTLVLSATLLAIAFSFIYWHIQSEYEQIRDDAMKDTLRSISWVQQNYKPSDPLDPQLADLANRSTFLYHTFFKEVQPKQKLDAQYFKNQSVDGISKKNIYSQLSRSFKRLDDVYRLKQELLTGRIHYDAEPLFKQPTAQEVLEKRRQMGFLPPGNDEMNLAMISEELRRSEGRLAGGDTKEWQFSGLPTESEDPFFLKMRLFYGMDLDSMTKTGELNVLISMWHTKEKVWSDPYPWQGRGARFYSLRLDPDYISNTGVAKIKITNKPLKKDALNAILIQRGDGPFILNGSANFFQSMAQSLLLFLGLLASFTAVGCSSGLLFANSMAILLSFFYFILGTFLHSMLQASVPPDFFGSMTYHFHYALSLLVTGLEDFQGSEYIARGQILSWADTLRTIAKEFILKGGFLLLCTLFFARRKEYGKVLRR